MAAAKNSLLSQVANEWTRSTGLGGEEVNEQRERALNYYKGDVDDVVAPEKRSRAVSQDVAEAIDSIMPDLIEIFTGSEDVVTFEPVGPEDEEAAQQETDYINYEFFKRNEGFLILHDMLKDACQVKTGIVKIAWCDKKEPDEDFEDQSLDSLAQALQRYGDRVVLSDETPISRPEIEPEEGGEPTYNYTVKGVDSGYARVYSVPPEDFGVSQDTTRLKESPYHWHRTRVRAYDLLNRGVSAETVAKLPAYGIMDTDMQQARSIGGEDLNDVGGDGDQRIVEVIEHYLLTKDGRKRVLTDTTCGIELESEDHDYVCFAAMTPYPVAHQFYGQSIADKLLEIQRIKTVLLRLALDSGNFALNQRMYVNMEKAHEWTMRDLLSNEPNRPIRGKGAPNEVISPMSSGGLSFDAFGALEYMSVQGEQRSGVMRNAQGLNPDTLHDTAKGASIMLSAAQKRTRMVARILAETGIKDLFLIMHRVIRENAKDSSRVRLKNKWVEIDRTSFGSRNDMTVEIGVGSGGKEQQMVMYQQGWQALEQLVTMQGGPSGPLVTVENIYAYAKQAFERGLGFRSADSFLTNPEEAPPQQPKPDPAMLEMQAKQQEIEQRLEFDKQKAAADMELAKQKAQGQLEVEAMKAEARLMAERERSDAMLQFEREKAQMQAQLARDKADFEARLAAQKAQDEYDLAQMQMASKERAEMSRNRPGGDLDK